MKKTLFRQVALNRLSSPEQLDALLQVTSTRGWVALAGIVLLLLTLSTWAFAARLPSKVTAGQCVLVRSGGVNVLTSAASGRLSDLAVEVGDRVTRGQIIGRLEQYDMLQKIKAQEDRLAEARAQFGRLERMAERGAELRSASIEQQRQHLERQMAVTRDKVRLTGERIDSQSGLYRQGLITKATLIGSQLEYAALQLDEQNVRSQLHQLEVTRQESGKQMESELMQGRNQVESLQRDVAAMVRDSKNATSIVSPYAGRVVEVKSVEGQLVERGTQLLTIESVGADMNELEAYIYLPAADGKKIAKGMAVEISPSTAKREEYGFLPAHVAAVADFPSSDQGLMRVFGNEKMVQQLSGSHAPIQIQAALRPAAGNPSGFQWSTRDGPPFPIQSGTQCSAHITLARQRPVDLLLPVVKRAAGMD